MALTATATPQVRDDVMQLLRMTGARVFVQDFNRANLKYIVCQKPVKRSDALPLLLEYIMGTHGPDAIGIVYCLSRDVGGDGGRGACTCLCLSSVVARPRRSASWCPSGWRKRSERVPVSTPCFEPLLWARS